MAPITAISLAIIVVFALVVLIKTIYGLIKGTGRAFLSLISVVAAAAITFFVALPVSSALAKTDISFIGYNAPDGASNTIEHAVVQYVEQIETEQGAIGKDIIANDTLLNAVKQSPVMVISVIIIPILFLLLALVLRIILILIFTPILRAVTKANGGKPSVTSRIVGAGIGFVCSVVVFGLTSMTLLGTLSLVRDPAEMTDNISEEYSQIEDNAVVKTFSGMGFDKLGLVYIKKASAFGVASGGESKNAFLTDEIENAGKLYVLMNESGVLKQENGSFEIDTDNILTNKQFILGAAEISKRSCIIKEMLPILLKYAAVGVVKETFVDFGAITAEEIDKLSKTYERLNDNGVFDAIKGGNSSKLFEILADEENAKELIDAAKQSSIISAVLEDSAKQAIVGMLSEQTLNADSVYEMLKIEDVKEMLKYPEARIYITLIGNEELNALVSKYDTDPDSITDDDIKNAIDSVMKQFNITWEDINDLYESQKNG